MIQAMDKTACLFLTATVVVQPDMCMTVRRDTSTRLADYLSAFKKWMVDPDVHYIVFVENTGYDLTVFRRMAETFPEKQVEFLSFVCPPFDGSLGKGYGEMLCLEHALQHSRLLHACSGFLKVTGRYYVRNAGSLLRFIANRSEFSAVCNFKQHLIWVDSRAFGGRVQFLRDYFVPMRHLINDSANSTFEHVLARAVHRVLSDRGRWSMTPQALEIEGISGSENVVWTGTTTKNLRQQIKHKLLARLLR
jgi:hypothetical protein